MAETNGNRDARMDRIERTLEMLVADHEQFRADHKQLLSAQVLQKDEIDQLLKITKEHTQQLLIESSERREKDKVLDQRVDNLVRAVGDLIARIPPAALT